MSTRAQRIVEMALNLGGASDWIDPAKKQQILRGTHPYANNPAFPKEPGEGSFPPGENEPRPGTVGSYAELVASDVYPKIVRKLSAALGQRMPRGPQAHYQILGMLQNALRSAVQFEQGHERELEQMAIQVVLDFPEYAVAKEAYEAGELKIIAQLRPEVDLAGSQAEPAEPGEEEKAELAVAQIAAELDLEKEKRRMINLMIQGAAVNKDHAYYNVQQELSALSPQLVNTYALLMSGGELAYWVLPEEMQQAAMGGGEGAAGVARFTFEDGVPTIHAQAIVFPVLIQEIVKGMMEYLSYDEESEESTRKHVYGQVDTLGNELWDIMKGPGVWRQILRQFGDDQRYVPYVYKALTGLSPEKFSKIVQQLLRGEPAGRDYIKGIIQKIKAEEGGGEQEPPDMGGGEPQEPPMGGPNDGAEDGSEDTGDDWWKKESKAARLVNRLLD